MTHQRSSGINLFHRAAAATEAAIDAARRDWFAKSGTRPPRQIAAYHGLAHAGGVTVSGRVLSNRPGGGPLDDDGWWDNLRNTFRRWESDEVPGVPVTVRFQENEIHTITDDEGYYRVDFPPIPPHHGSVRWLPAAATVGSIVADHQIMAPPCDAEFGIISDLDDTVIHTGITSLLLAAKLTFLENAKTRKPLEGVAKLYEALQRGRTGVAANPLFYISSSPWNLHDLLVDFLQVNEIPQGPLLLRDLGLDRTKFIKEKGHRHKFEKAVALLEAYPGLPFVLIGDSGQEDPSIYAEVARLHPDRVLAIYIRDVHPETEDELALDAAGVPSLLAKDSRSISEHARRIGLLPDSAIPEVAAEVAADKERPEVGTQALEDAVRDDPPPTESAKADSPPAP